MVALFSLPLIVSMCLILWPVVGVAAADSMTFSVDIPAGQWKKVRLKNLSKDMTIALGVECDGPLSVGFLDSQDNRRFPHEGHPLFWEQSESKLAFSVTIQANGDYYVVLDNRQGTARRSAQLSARATLGGEAAQALLASQLRKVEDQLRTLEKKLAQTFAFDPIPLHIRACQRSLSFDRSDGLVLCLEYARQLMTTFQDKTQASDALVYSMFQELAQILQSQWNLESSDPATTLDELTTVLMLTFRLDANVRAYSQTVLNQPALTASLTELFHDPLHPLSAERAQRVLKWATDPQLVQRWQAHLVPHFQTRMLEHLQQHPQPWTDPALIEKELASRSSRIPEKKPKLRAHNLSPSFTHCLAA